MKRDVSSREAIENAELINIQLKISKKRLENKFIREKMQQDYLDRANKKLNENINCENLSKRKSDVNTCINFSLNQFS